MTDLTKWVVVPVDPTEEMLSAFTPMKLNATVSADGGIAERIYQNWAHWQWADVLFARPTGPDVPVLIDAGELEQMKHAIAKYKAAMDALYNHNTTTRQAVIEHFGVCHPKIALDIDKESGE